jgi:phosphoribosylglycinamide formyltransferase-1
MTTAVILISGRGSNMQAILEAKLSIRVACVISNDPAAAGLATARHYGVETTAIDHRSFPDRAGFDARLAETIDSHRPDVVVLAGFMRILTPGFVARYQGRLVNIHPSLLPSFPGLDTHRRAIEAGVRIHGCTVHYVTPELDAGPIIVQAAVPVLPDDDEDRLAARVLAQEHLIYPQALRWIATGRVRLGPDGRVQHATAIAAGALIAPALDA